MKPSFLRSVSLALGLLSGQSVALASTGLWVGTATLNAVTEAAPRAADLAFDLALVWHREQEPLVAAGGAWRYNDAGGDLGSQWRGPGYADVGWEGGAAPFHYGPGQVLGPAVQPTVYFRRAFDVADPLRYSAIRLKVAPLQQADGAAVYLNGIEVHRVRLATEAGFGAYASLPASADSPEVIVPPELVRHGSNSVAVEVHRSDASDQELSFDLELSGTLAPPSAYPLVSPGSAWRFDESGQDLGAGWRAPGFDDSTWREGSAPFEFGEGSRLKPVVYFRRVFDVAEPSALAGVQLRLRRDDGAVVYLNGQEVLRSNLPPEIPDGQVDFATPPVLALTSAEGREWVTKSLPTSRLVNGPNVLAAEVHQHPSEFGAANAAGGVTATPAAFDLRLLVHVDAANQTRLLKEVIQVYDTEQRAPVLLTDPARVPLATYTGIALRDGVPVGRRMSAAGFDFGTPDEDPANPGCLKLAGAFGATGSVTGQFTIRSDQPTNPFLHRYHPDHDNWDPRHENPKPEAYEVVRTVTLQLSSGYPPGWVGSGGQARPPPPLGWGDTIVGGIYIETLSQLHRTPIQVRGAFTLKRISAVGSLNP